MLKTTWSWTTSLPVFDKIYAIFDSEVIFQKQMTLAESESERRSR